MAQLSLYAFPLSKVILAILSRRRCISQDPLLSLYKEKEGVMVLKLGYIKVNTLKPLFWNPTSIYRQHTQKRTTLDTNIGCNRKCITAVPLYLDLCKHFPGIFKSQCVHNEGLRWELGLHTYSYTDIHKGQHFIHQPLYTPTHQPSCPSLYHSIHLPPSLILHVGSSSAAVNTALQIILKDVYNNSLLRAHWQNNPESLNLTKITWTQQLLKWNSQINLQEWFPKPLFLTISLNFSLIT